MATEFPSRRPRSSRHASTPGSRPEPLFFRPRAEGLEDRSVPDATYHILANGNFSQNWSNISLITTDDNWDNVPSIIGFRGDGLVSSTNVDPQTILGESTVVDVNANKTNPNTFTTGGVTEFELPNPTIALQGSGTARAPYIQIHVNTTGMENIQISYVLRDLETGSDTGVQQVALQYRIGETGTFVNVPAGYVAAATPIGPVAGPDIPINVMLPAALANQSKVQIRIITSDALGNDQWVGIDDILITGTAMTGTSLSIAATDADKAEGNSSTTPFTFTITRSGNTTVQTKVDFAVTGSGSHPANAADFGGTFPSGQVTFEIGETTKVLTIHVSGDTDPENHEGFTVTLSNPTGGATLSIATADGRIRDDDTPLPLIYISEIHFNPPGIDAPNEYVELRGTPNSTIPAGVYLVGIEGDTGGNAGDVQTIFDLSGLEFGANGYLVLLQNGNSYSVDPNAKVYTSSSAGFGGFSFFSADSSETDIENASVSFLLVRALEPPLLTDDIDANNDGTPDGPVFPTWEIIDSVAVLDGNAADVSYGAVVFAVNDAGIFSPGAVVINSGTNTANYVARIGESTGATAADWVAGGVEGTAPNFTLIAGETRPASFDGKALNHIGSFNFPTPPTVTINTTPLSYVEGNGPSFPTVVVDPLLVLSDDGVMLIGATVQISGGYVPGQDLLAATAVAGITVSGFNTTTATLTLSGIAPLSDYQTVLRSVTFSSGDNPGDGDRVITVLVTDSHTLTSSPATRTIEVTPVNDAPVILIPATATVLEDVASSLGTITVSDADAGTNPLIVTLTVTSGTLTLADDALITAGANNSETFTLTGSQTAITAALTGLTFTTAANSVLPVTLTIEANDQGASPNTGGPATSQVILPITVTAVNDAPSFNVGSDVTILEDAGPQTVAAWATAISAGPADEASQVLTFNVSTDNNALFAVLPAIDPLTGDLTFTPAANANGSATVTVSLSDTGGTANGGVDTSAPQTFTITVTAVNDAPSFTLPQATITSFTNSGPQVRTGFLSHISAGPNDESSQVLSVILVPTGGTLSFDVPPSIDLLGTLTYTASTPGTATFTVSLKDDGGTVNGGVDTSAGVSFTIVVMPLPVPPVANDDAFLTPFNTRLVIPAPGLLANDIDPDSPLLSIFDITGVSPAGAGTLTVTASGGLEFLPTRGFSGLATFSYRVSDGGLISVPATVRITVGEPPPAVNQNEVSRFAATSATVQNGQVTVLDGSGTPVLSVIPFAGRGSDVRVAVADGNGDTIPDLFVASGPGSPTRLVWMDGVSGRAWRFVTPFEDSFTGGAFVAAADLTGDGLADVAVSPDVSGGPRVVIYDSRTGNKIVDFYGIDDPNFRGGARIAFADVNGDGTPDLLVAAGVGGGPRVAIWDGKSLREGNPRRLVSDFFVFEATLRDGVFITAGDINNDGFADIVAGGGPGGGPRVVAIDGLALLERQGGQFQLLANFFSGDPGRRDGARVAVKDLDGDFFYDLVVSVGNPQNPEIYGYAGKSFGPEGLPGTVLFDPSTILKEFQGVYVG